MKAKRSLLVLSSLFFGAMLIAGATQAGAQTNTPRLEFLMGWHADFTPTIDIGQLTTGHREIYTISGGTFSGPKLRGKILPGPVDWFLTTPDGVGHMDVRATLQTDDGANILLHYQGVHVNTPTSGAKFSKGEVIDYGDSYWISALFFETGDPRYAWLNNIVAVGQARLDPKSGWIEQRDYQVLD